MRRTSYDSHLDAFRESLEDILNGLKTSAEVARLLNVPYWRLHSLVRRGVLAVPLRHGKSWAWRPADVELARQALAKTKRGA